MANMPVAQVYCHRVSVALRMATQGSKGPDDITKGTLNRSQTMDIEACMGGDVSPEMMKSAPSWTIRLWARAPALLGSLSLSTTTSSTGCRMASTITPPWPLISSTAALIPKSPPEPKLAYIPVNDWTTPIFTGFGFGAAMADDPKHTMLLNRVHKSHFNRFLIHNPLQPGSIVAYRPPPWARLSSFFFSFSRK